MTIIEVNEINNSLEGRVEASWFDRAFMLVWGSLIVATYPLTRAAVFLNEKVKPDPDYWKKEVEWLNNLAPAAFRTVYHGDWGYWQETLGSRQ